MAFARLGLLGNPGDGYEGKALATLVYDFAATVSVTDGEDFAIHPNPRDGLRFPSLGKAADSFAGGGCEDGLRLIRAAVRRFHLLVGDPDGTLGSRCVQIRYDTSIPRQVGLSGSSALVIATMRALAAHFGIALDPFELSEGALAAEVEDLGIAAGPMDRIVQSYEGTVVMDLAPPRSPEGIQSVDTALLPPLFLAWAPDRTKSSGRLHSPLRERWERGDPEVLEVVSRLRDLVDEGMKALENRNVEAFGRAMTENFALRSRIFSIHPGDRAMVTLAERMGSPAKLAGSGGAIVGLIPPGADPEVLAGAFEKEGFVFLRPRLSTPQELDQGER